MPALSCAKRRPVSRLATTGSSVADAKTAARSSIKIFALGEKEDGATTRGFLGALRSELYHDKINITLTEVDLPAVNTPQFDWARNKTGHRAQPVPPIYQSEVAARAIYFGAFNPRRQIWVGFPTVKAILANRIAPGLLDRYLAKFGYTGQLSDQPSDPNAPGNLFEPVTGAYGAHGRFNDQARTGSWEMVTSRHHIAAWAVAFVGWPSALTCWPSC